MALLEVLASQAAISLENARLYGDLQERDARIRQLVDSSIMGIFFWRLDGITDANDAFLRMIGYSRDDLLAGRVQWSAITPPEVLPMEERLLAQLLRTGQAPTYERDFIRPDGARVPAMVGGVLLGLIEALGSGYLGTLTGGVLGSHYADIFAFVVLILVLTLRPSGLLGERVADRA